MRNVPAFAWLLLLVTPVASAAPATGSRPENARKPASMIVESEKPGDETPPIPEGDERRAIGDTIRDNSGPVRECYEKRLQQRPTLQGKLVVRFDIGPAGKVIGATTEGIADRELSVCVLAAVRKLQFEKPRSGGKLRIAYPFKFEPKPAK
jgi:TonB family protein